MKSQKSNSSINKLASEIFNLKKDQFESTAIKVFQLQYENNVVYRQYCDYIERKQSNVKTLHDIPFLPISVFKTHEVKTSFFSPEIIFTSSGTTGEKTSKHFIKSTKVYRNSFVKGFEQLYDPIGDYCILALLPAYMERTGSSLIYMVEYFSQKSKHPQNGFYLYNHRDLYDSLNELAKTEQKTLLIGVSFALLDFAEKHQIQANPNLIVMETGGMKGRRKELIRNELHETLAKSFQVDHIHSEYGMTELLSQAYAKQGGFFKTPNWMKVLLRKQDDPFNYCQPNETGGINVIDLANLYSCSFIQTDDLGRYNNQEEFEVLGRFDQSDVRGCNLMVY